MENYVIVTNDARSIEVPNEILTGIKQKKQELKTYTMTGAYFDIEYETVKNILVKKTTRKECLQKIANKLGIQLEFRCPDFAN
jgi:hypothetical protein